MSLTFEEIDQSINDIDISELGECLHCGGQLIRADGMDADGDPYWETYCSKCGYVYVED